MELNFIEVVRELILPIITIALGYFGWRANADRNKLKAELKGLEASNTSKEIENQSSWIDLYEKLADDQAKRMTSMGDEIQVLNKNIKRLENALNKIHNCRHYDLCPVRDALELSKPERVARNRPQRKPATNRQREPVDRENDTSNDSTTDDGEDQPHT